MSAPSDDEVVEVSSDAGIEPCPGNLHAEWAKENSAPYPPDLDAAPERGAVDEMVAVLEMAEAIVRDLPCSFDRASWVGPLTKLQRRLAYLAKAAESSKWTGSGFVRLLRDASAIRMRPLSSTADKELLRASDGKCMICGSAEHQCTWAFDLARIWRREGARFLDEPLDQNIEHQRNAYGADASEFDPEFDEFHGRFTVGKTCLRKVHLAFWARNFFPYLYEWVDAALNTDVYERCLLDDDCFAVATRSAAVFWIKQIETAEHALRTDSEAVRLPELPLRFQSFWNLCDADEPSPNPGWNSVGLSDADPLQAKLGGWARLSMMWAKKHGVRPYRLNARRNRDKEEEEEEEEEEGKISSRTRASTQQQQRKRRAGQPAPAEQREAGELDLRSGDEEDEPQPRRRRVRPGVNRVVRSDDEHSSSGGGDEFDAPHDGPAAETATRCSFAPPPPPPIEPPARAAKSSGVGSCNHEASGSADNGAPSPPAADDDDDPFEAAARQIKRHCVHLVRAIGHDMAAEALRDDLPQRAANRAALADAIASRLASEVLGDEQ